jgi:hypothetical protein
VFTDSDTSASFSNKNVGTGKTVTVSGINISGPAAGNYTFNTTAATTANITRAPLTITANDASKVYGAALPTFSASYNGFVDGETAASLTTPPMLATTATSASHVQAGGYTITASGAADANYAITYVPGVLTITPAPLTIAANPESMVFGDALPVLTASYSGFVNSDTPAILSKPAILTTPATSTSLAGAYPIYVSGASSTDYAITFVPGTLTITAANANPTFTTSGGTTMFGQPVSFTVQVNPTGSGGSDLPGVLTFFIDGVSSGTAAVDPSTGRATYTTTDMGVGSHMITAVYSDPSGASTSAPIREVVVAADTKPILTAVALRNRHHRIMSVTLTVDVEAVAPGQGVPTGTVAYNLAVRKHSTRISAARKIINFVQSPFT